MDVKVGTLMADKAKENSPLICCKRMKCFCFLCNQRRHTSLTSDAGGRYSLIIKVILGSRE